MRIDELTVGPVQTRCYILYHEDEKECIVIDPGDEPERIRKRTGDRRIAAILLTHGHFDHIGGVAPLMEEGTRLVIHPLDEKMLSDPELNVGMVFFRKSITAPAPTDRVREGDELTIAGLKIKVLHISGHTPGSVCYRFSSDEDACGVVDGSDDLIPLPEMCRAGSADIVQAKYFSVFHSCFYLSL